MTEKQVAEIIGRSLEEVRSLVLEGMPQNPDGTFDMVHCIAWKLIQDPPDTSGVPVIELAQEFLLDVLDEGRKPAREVCEAAKVAGFTERTIERAKAKLRIISKRDGKEWFWELPSAGCQ